MPHPVIGIVEDDEAIRDSLRLLLGARGLDVSCFDSVTTFLNGAKVDQLSALIVDQNMPGMTGIELVELLRSRGILKPSIVITGASDPLLASRAAKAGALTVLNKPVPAGELVKWIYVAISRSGEPNGGPS